VKEIFNVKWELGSG